MTRFLLSLFLFFGLVLSARAADPFTIAGVPVDARGSSAIEAQTKAIRDGQSEAARRLIERLTLQSERQTNPLPPLSADSAARMIRALEISNERRSSNRYLGDITVAFKPRDVQTYLNSAGLTMITSQSRERLVLPFLGGGLNPKGDVYEAWGENRYANALTPIRALPADQISSLGLSGLTPSIAGDIDRLRNLGQIAGVDQILIANYAGGGIRVTDIALDSGETDEFVVSGSNPEYQLVTRLEREWKADTAVLAGQAETMSVSVLYDSLSDWQALKTAIDGSAQIQDARLDAMSKDGALMTLTYAGDMDRLTRELSFKGVDIREDREMGVVLTRSGR
ncbi:hypothetical protein [Litorimonas haliclonae]|uniref:hypothetical protein n=1 Tax=Litorimonas haliclonae TaxID=2081977 RepID=UPI0039EE5C7B